MLQTLLRHNSLFFIYSPRPRSTCISAAASACESPVSSAITRPFAPYNVLMYAGSAVPNQPVIPVERFPELQNCATIGRRSATKR
jgi:hypothetical protein